MRVSVDVALVTLTCAVRLKLCGCRHTSVSGDINARRTVVAGCCFRVVAADSIDNVRALQMHNLEAFFKHFGNQTPMAFLWLILAAEETGYFPIKVEVI